MEQSRRGIWVENALGLAVLTLATILLNASLVWVIIERVEVDRRKVLAQGLAEVLAAQLEFEREVTDGPEGYVRVLEAYQAVSLPLDELYVVDRDLAVLASVGPAPVPTWDPGMRMALLERRQHTATGRLSPSSVAVTWPLSARGRPDAALRLTVSLAGGPLPGGSVGFVLAYTAACAAIVGLFGWALFRRNLIRPIEVLVNRTRRIADGDFGTQISLSASRELVSLCEALNAMSSSLAEYRTRTADQVADLEAARDRLAAAKARLEETQDALIRSEKLATVGTVAAGLAHEVGNPLAAVRGFLELLARGLPDPALEREVVSRAREELERIHRVIRQLLDYARPGTGQVEDLDVAAAMSAAAQTVRHQPGWSRIALSVEAEPGLAAVRLERDKLHQVLVNLLMNAGDAVRAAGEPGTVWLSAHAEAERVRIRCEDTGPGFSEEALRRAMEPFYTTKGVGRGTGLGLATASVVAEAAGGDLAIGNRPEGGACVTLRLPIAPRP